MSNAYQMLFEPTSYATSISATTSSARTALATPPTDEGLGNATRRVVAIGTETGDGDIFIKFGDSSVTVAADAGSLIPGGQLRGFVVPIGATHVAAITASGTATVCVENGKGF